MSLLSLIHISQVDFVGDVGYDVDHPLSLVEVQPLLAVIALSLIHIFTGGRPASPALKNQRG